MQACTCAPVRVLLAGMNAPESLNRRQALRRLSAGLLLSLDAWPGRAAHGESEAGSFRFIVVNDTHYMSPACGTWLGGAIEGMKAHPGVEFCLLAGDLTEYGHKSDLEAVRGLFHELGLPTYVVIGNHDYETAASRWAYERHFPRRLNYLFRHRGWQFVGLDTTEGQKYQRTRIQSETLRWLDDHLRFLDRRKPTVVFTHFPLGTGVTYRPVNADALLERFLPFNLQAVFNGHFHGFTQRMFGRAKATTNKCCSLKRANHDGTKEKGYFLCTARDGRVTREFVPVPVPTTGA
jgi:Calcineurin-like phosphoesterase